MWNDQSIAGGGFLNSDNRFGNISTPNQAQKSGKRASRTAPIVIKQALSIGDNGVKIWGTEIQIVSIVARVKKISAESTKITYTIQDITGIMSAVLWLDQDSTDDKDHSIQTVEVNNYIQIYGNVKTNKGKKVLMAFKIMLVTDVNAITFHYLHCIYNKLKMEANSKKEQTNNNSKMHDNEALNGLNVKQNMVYNLITESIQEHGISQQDIYAGLKHQMSHDELSGILLWLVSEGHIFTTIDDDHYQITQ